MKRAGSLGRNDASEGMARGQHNAAVIDRLRRTADGAGEARPFDQRSAAGRAPVGLRVRRENGMAMGADAVHEEMVPRSGHAAGRSKWAMPLAQV